MEREPNRTKVENGSLFSEPQVNPPSPVMAEQTARASERLGMPAPDPGPCKVATLQVSPSRVEPSLPQRHWEVLPNHSQPTSEAGPG